VELETSDHLLIPHHAVTWPLCDTRMTIDEDARVPAGDKFD
jgi:hypothetical protein